MASTEREEWSSVVALAATASTVAASAALVGSVLHDWVYFGRLGLRFSEVPTSLVDHARTALLWLPPLGIGMALFSVYELLTRRIEGGKTEDEIVAQSPNPKWAARFRRSGDVGPLVMAAVVIFGGYLLFGGSPFQSELGLGVAVGVRAFSRPRSVDADRAPRDKYWRHLPDPHDQPWRHGCGLRDGAYASDSGDHHEVGVASA